MANQKIKRALISAYDKTGLADFARALVDEFGIEIISTGGTAALLKEEGIPVTLVEQVTGFPEMMDGRVKTLHPKIHAAILADRDNPEHMRQLEEQGIVPIDMVVVNLYPFEKTVADPNCTFEQAIEMIDIGGPCLLRAAAKNHKHVVVVSDSAQTKTVLERMMNGGGTVDSDTRLDLSFEAFDATSNYDQTIHLYLAHQAAEATQEPDFKIGQDRLRLPIRRLHSALRYGENPHQHAAAYKTDVSSPRSGITVLRHKPLSGLPTSFNNYVDANAAMLLCSDLADELCKESAKSAAGNVCVFVKHTNACGAAVADDPIEVYRRAYCGDPNAAMGGILACSFPIAAEFAHAVMETFDRWGRGAGAGGFFVEMWVAPAFEDDAMEVINTGKKWGQRVRLLPVGINGGNAATKEMDVKKITGGMLVQSPDRIGLNEGQWKVATRRAPTDEEMNDLRLAWLVCKHTKSNAITICKDNMLIGNGAGQMSRVMSCRIATWLAKENGHAERLPGSAAASDAFFPFADGPNILIDAGVTAIIQPGGSKRDEESVKACDDRGVAMIFTGTRHFRH